MIRPLWCWCCAQWGLAVPASLPDQGGGFVCARCHDSSPAACRNRHMAEALKAGAAR